MLARTKNVLAVAGSSPYKSVDDLLQAGKARHLSYASVGNGSSSHIIGEFITRKHGIKTTHVPYRGGGPALLDLIGGQVDFMAATYGTVANYIKDGRIRVLAVSDEERDARLPGVPTFKEAGLPSLGLDTSIGVYAPAGVPRPIVNQWSAALAKVVTAPDYASTLEAAGFELRFMPVDAFEKFHRQEVPRLGAIIREANVELN
jgi:tripartite-type tricarboxylate transporter receptor subunit TctC